MVFVPMLCSSARGPKHLSCASGRVRVHGPEVGEGVPVWKSNDSAEGVHGASAVLAERRLLKANALSVPTLPGPTPRTECNKCGLGAFPSGQRPRSEKPRAMTLHDLSRCVQCLTWSSGDITAGALRSAALPVQRLSPKVHPLL